MANQRCLSTGAGLLLGVIAAGMLSGCQSHGRRPLDARAHRAEFLSRCPDHPELLLFAESLRGADGTAVVYDASDGLTLAEGEVVALVYNADLRVARLRAGVASAAAEHAGLWEDPVLGLDFGRIIERSPHPWMVMSTIGLTIPVSGRLEMEKRRAGAEHAASIARVYADEWRTRIELRLAWLEWSAAVKRRETLEQLVGRIEEIVRIVSAIERAGELSRIEASLFRVELAGRRAEHLRAGAELAEREQIVLRLLGLPPGASAGLVPSLHGAMPATLDGLAALSLERSPHVAVAVTEYEAAERRLELELRRQYPDIQIAPGVGREDGENRLLLGVGLSLPIWNRNRAGIAAALAEREVARALFEASLELLASEIEVARARLVGAQRERNLLEEQVVPLVDEHYATARSVAEMGEVNVFVLLDSLTRQQDTKLRLIEARLAESRAAVRLVGLVGPGPVDSPQEIQE